MKTPVLFRTKSAVPLDMKNASPAPADVPLSQHTSTSQIEKEKTTSRASDKEKKDVVTTPLAEAEALDNLSDEPEYPSGLKLGIVMASLCLSVFLMALVGLILQILPPKRSIKSLTPPLSKRDRQHRQHGQRSNTVSGQYHYCYRNPENCRPLQSP